MTEEARPWPVLSRTLTPMMLAPRRDAAELHGRVAALVERQGRGAVAGDEAGDERAVTGVVVRASSCLLTKSFQPTMRLLPRSEVVAMPLSRTATPTPAPVGPPAAGAATLSRPIARLVMSSELA